MSGILSLNAPKNFFKSYLIGLFFLAFFSAISITSASITNGTIDGTSRYAWSENLGWIDFGTTEGAVSITDSALSGWAWGENVGWISLNCSNTSSCGTVDYKVSNNGEGTLTGYAYGENIGWVQFNPSGGGVTINSSGDFAGYAWGENVGWIVFNCSTTSSCGSVNYKVSTDWRPQSARPACNNSLDDDSDTVIDYPADTGCDSLSDTDETNAVTPPAPTPSPSGGGGGALGLLPIIQKLQQNIVEQPEEPDPLPVSILETVTVPRQKPEPKPDLPTEELDIPTFEIIENGEPIIEEQPVPEELFTSKVEIIVVDTNKKAVEGAKVTLHSIPRIAFTDKYGKVVFENVESGDHRIVVSYRGQEGEQAIKLDQSISEFQFKIQIEAKNPLLQKETIIVISVLVLIIILILTIKFKRRNE